MTNLEFFDDPITVTAKIDTTGNTKPEQIIWKGTTYRVVTVGRQWQTENGRHVLVETSDGARYELLLSKQELVWRLKRFWPVVLAA